MVLNLGLVLQNPHRRQIVFHLLKSIQHRLSIVRDLRVISRTRLVGESATSSHVKDGPNGRQSKRPEAARTIKQGSNAGAFKSSRGAQADRRVVGRLRNSDLGVGGCNQSFCSCNIRASFQQYRRHTNRDVRRRCGEGQRRKAELRGWFSDQNCDCVFKLRSRHANIDRLCPGGLKYGLCLFNFYLRSNTSLEAAFIQFQGLLILCNRSVQELFLGIQAASLKVINSQIRVHAQVNGSQVRGAGLRLLSRGLHGFSNSSPDVGLIGNVEGEHKVVEGGAAQQ